MLRPFPLPQYLDMGRQLDDLLADHARMRRVVAGHDQQRGLALTHEFAGHAEREIAAEHLSPNLFSTSASISGRSSRMPSTQICTRLWKTSRLSAWPIGFCNTAAVIRFGASSHKVRQNEAPIQPPMR